MYLKITRSNIPDVVERGDAVSLQTNGRQLRLFHWHSKRIAAVIDRAEMHFHTDDAKTSVDIDGYIETAGRIVLFQISAE